MAKNRKRSPSERVRQKRLASSPPVETARPAEPLHVAPLAPPPVFTETLPRPVVVADAAEGPPKGAPVSEAPERPEVEPSLVPVSSNAELTEAMVIPRPSPWLRRGAALASVFAAVAGIAIGFKIMRPRATHATAARSAPPAQVVEQAAPAPLPVPAPPPPPAATVEAVAPRQPPETPAVSAAPTATVSAAASEVVASAAALRDQALDLLKKAKNPEAMVTASAALEADPTDAMPYLVLGSALQDAGRWREAHRAYELCVKNAKHGMVDECRAMLRAR